jgi:hypothetical protein
MNQYKAKNLQVDGTNISLDIEGKGRLTVDLAVWDSLLTSIGGQDNIKKAKIIGDDLLEFPNNIHIEVEDIIALAEQQKKLPECD